VQSSEKSAKIIGLWRTAGGTATVEICQRADRFYGKIVWSKQQEESSEVLLDIHNSVDSLRTKPIIGLEILRDFVFEDDQFEEGKIYDPESGNDYKAKMNLPNDNTLEIRGYILVPLLGRSEVWTRVEGN